MTDQHAIIPPLELMEEWNVEGRHQDYCTVTYHIATRAAQWGANQELEACCEWLLGSAPWTVDPDERPGWIDVLRAERRPRPPNLREQALMALEDGDTGSGASLTSNEVDIIRRALEALND